MSSALYPGTVVHARRTPAENVFRYGMYAVLLDLDEVPALDRRLRLFSHNRPGALSFYDRDHPLDSRDPSAPLKPRVVRLLADRGIDIEGGRVLLLTNLRVLGYVFNPVSFFYCYGRDGQLEAVVAEVWNTFGETWPYVLAAADRLPGAPGLAFQTGKRLHVSPFFGLEQEYRFFLSEPGARLYARVDVWQDGRRRFGSVLAGHRVALDDRALARAFARYPLVTLQVIAFIHWQALKLWWRGVPFHHKPPFVPGPGSLRGSR